MRLSLLVGILMLCCSLSYATPFDFGSAGFSPAALDGLELVVSTTIVTAPIDSFEFSNLDINTDGHYLLLFNVSNNSGSVQGYDLFVNGDLGQANYRTQRSAFIGSTVSSGRVSNAYILTLIVSDVGSGYAFIDLDSQNYYRASSNVNRGIAPNPFIAFRYVVSTGTHTNITSLTLDSLVGTGISTGTTLDLYKFERN